jgi:hypothetical protein
MMGRVGTDSGRDWWAMDPTMAVCPGVCPEPVGDRRRKKQRRLSKHRLRTRQPDERSAIAAERKRRGCDYERNRSG